MNARGKNGSNKYTRVNSDCRVESTWNGNVTEKSVWIDAKPAEKIRTQ